MSDGQPSVLHATTLTVLPVLPGVSVSVSTPPLAVPPLSWTVQVRLLLPFASETVLYFSPCSCARFTVLLAFTCLFPSESPITTNIYTPSLHDALPISASSLPPPTP